MISLTALIGLLVIVILVVSIPVFFGGFGTKVKNKNNGHTRAGVDKLFVQKKWNEVNNTFKIGGTSNLKTSIMEADKLVDFVLLGRGVAGQTMGERLKNVRSSFSDKTEYDNLWFAHKVRNNIAHEATHDINMGEARRAIEYFEKALKRLGAL